MKLPIQIIAPQGRLDSNQIPIFRAEVDALIGNTAALLLIDLSQVPFVDSAGLGSIVSILKALRNQGGDVALCALSEGVKILFKLTRMDSVFEIYPDQAAFLAAHADV